jgi:1,4-alpha-glucan branching enzyme
MLKMKHLPPLTEKRINKRLRYALSNDQYLKPYAENIEERLLSVIKTEQRLTQGKGSLVDFASGHEFFGLHTTSSGWIFREWAPNATAIFIIGAFSGWQEDAHYSLTKISSDGTWEILLPTNILKHEDLYRLRVHWKGGAGDRIPTYARRVHQDPNSLIFNAQVWAPSIPYQWQHAPQSRNPEPLIYEAHIGMAQDKEAIGSYQEFTSIILPRIIEAGYNTLQLMAIQQHPYYGSFGYHVSNFFAASSRFGTPEDLKQLIDTAHGAGLTVLMDIVHSHAVKNEVEGISLFDGTEFQFFHEGPQGYHDAWDSRCFDYQKPQVLHFLLSNCKYWLDDYRIDGFRFDGITSMLYTHHGLSKAFTTYDDYFGEDVDVAALTYLTLANKLIHQVRPDATTIAEDVSGMPGLAAPLEFGGAGFDYRFAMGVPDNWIQLAKDVHDEDWPMGQLWFELNNRRKDERTISYVESHDQALVGDQSLIFRLIGADMYAHMRKGDEHLIVDRGIALHKVIRLITLATAGHGYLNFMGNEFGHPEWIDFPRPENNWSYRYAHRQWHLADNADLKYEFLSRFDQEMIRLAKRSSLLLKPVTALLHEHNDDKVIAFSRADHIFIFNFHPTRSYVRYGIHAPTGTYKLVLDTDSDLFGGHGRLHSNQTYAIEKDNSSSHQLHLYLPTRTGLVLALQP